MATHVKMNMEHMKETIVAKTFWVSIASLATGIGLCLNGDVPNGLNGIYLGLIGIFGRHAITKKG